MSNYTENICKAPRGHQRQTSHLFLSPIIGGSEEWDSVLQGHRRAGPLFSERDHRPSADGVSLLWKQQLQGLVRGAVGQQQIPGLHHQRSQGVSKRHGRAGLIRVVQERGERDRMTSLLQRSEIH